jgi:hypothetical protein
LTEVFSEGGFSWVSLGDGESFSDPFWESRVGDLFPSCDDLMDEGFEL